MDWEAYKQTFLTVGEARKCKQDQGAFVTSSLLIVTSHGRRAEDFLGVSYRTLTPFRRASPSWHTHLSNARLQILSQWGTGFSKRFWGGVVGGKHKHADHNNSVGKADLFLIKFYLTSLSVPCNPICLLNFWILFVKLQKLQFLDHFSAIDTFCERPLRGWISWSGSEN